MVREPKSTTHILLAIGEDRRIVRLASLRRTLQTHPPTRTADTSPLLGLADVPSCMVRISRALLLSRLSYPDKFLFRHFVALVLPSVPCGPTRLSLTLFAFLVWGCERWRLLRRSKASTTGAYRASHQTLKRRGHRQDPPDNVPAGVSDLDYVARPFATHQD